MKWFDYVSPQTVEEAVGLLAKRGARARILAGGTDLLTQMRNGKKEADLVVDIKRIPEVNQIAFSTDRGLKLGAAVPCYRIYGDRAILTAYPGLIDVARMIGGTLIQGRATIGGNLANAAPSADSIPVLIALSASCEVRGPNGTRQIPVESFCTAPGQTVLGPGEMLVSLHFPAPQRQQGVRYLRFTPRNEMDIAVAGAGVSLILDNGMIRSARVALASVAPTPLFVREAGDWLTGKPASEASFRAAADIAKTAARPITDMRGTADYRRHLCAVLTRRALEAAAARAKEAN